MTKEAPSNFHKGLLSRATAAEREVVRLRERLSAVQRELDEAQKAIPIAVLDGLNVTTKFFMDSEEAIIKTTGRDFADAERAAEWVKRQYAR